MFLYIDEKRGLVDAERTSFIERTRSSMDRATLVTLSVSNAAMADSTVFISFARFPAPVFVEKSILASSQSLKPEPVLEPRENSRKSSAEANGTGLFG